VGRNRAAVAARPSSNCQSANTQSAGHIGERATQSPKNENNSRSQPAINVGTAVGPIELVSS
jgi:hypothetical protein